MKQLAILATIVLEAACGWCRDPAEFNGSYLWSANPAEAVAVAREVDAAVASVNFLLRPIARPKLRKSTAPYQSIDLAAGASNTIVFTRAGAPVIHGKLGGETVKWEREEGTVFDVAFVLTADGKLQQTFREADGSRENLFTLAPDGTNMTMEVTISSKRLDKPVKYSLTYVKQAAKDAAPADQPKR